ncbi:MAG: hypothetical protein IRY98_11060 [Alicyclobacillaceae bacterium]|nr:hypothetical protein [Alicyclobacillaceae bacterium]
MGAYSGAWRRVDWAKALVVEALVQAEICRRRGRAAAVRHWDDVARQRMRGTVWRTKDDRVSVKPIC